MALFFPPFSSLTPFLLPARNIASVAEAARNTSQGAHRTERTSGDLARAAKQLSELVGHSKCE